MNQIEMENIVENSINNILNFFNDLTINSDGDIMDVNCDPNGPGCIHFDCRGCPTLC